MYRHYNVTCCRVRTVSLFFWIWTIYKNCRFISVPGAKMYIFLWMPFVDADLLYIYVIKWKENTLGYMYRNTERWVMNVCICCIC